MCFFFFTHSVDFPFNRRELRSLTPHSLSFSIIVPAFVIMTGVAELTVSDPQDGWYLLCKTSPLDTPYEYSKSPLFSPLYIWVPFPLQVPENFPLSFSLCCFESWILRSTGFSLPFLSCVHRWPSNRKRLSFSAPH